MRSQRLQVRKRRATRFIEVSCIGKESRKGSDGSSIEGCIFREKYGIEGLIWMRSNTACSQNGQG